MGSLLFIIIVFPVPLISKFDNLCRIPIPDIELPPYPILKSFQANK